MAIAVRDLSGQVAFYIDGEVARDDAGKVIGVPRRGSEDREVRLARYASCLLSGKSVEHADQRLLLGDLAVGDVSQAATRASFGIVDGECVADRVSPVRYIKHFSGTWYAENVLDAIQLVTAEGVLDGTPVNVNPAFTPTAFTTVGRALSASLPKYTQSNADFDLKARTVRFLVEKLRLAREYRVAQLLITTNNWATANRISPVAKWNGGTNSNPLTDMFAALAASYLPANVIVMPEVAAQYFFAGPQGTATNSMRDYVQSGGEMPKILFARARFGTTASDTPSYVWAPGWTAGNGLNVSLVRVPDDPNSLASSVTFRWLADDNKATADGRRFEGVLVREFTDPQNKLLDWVVVAHNDAEVQVSNQIGATIVGALQ